MQDILGISIIYVRVDDYDEDNIMWYMMMIDGKVYDEPEYFADAGEEAAKIIEMEEVRECVINHPEFLKEVDEYLEEMSRPEAYDEALYYVQEEIEYALDDEDENANVYGISFIFDEDGWGREPEPIGIHW